MAEIRVPIERVRRGRPPLADKEKLEGIQFRVPKGMLGAFTELSRELGCTKSDLYRAAFREYLKRAKVEWEDPEAA